MKTSELTGEKLREWVARAQGWKVELDVDSLICFDEADTVHSFGEFGYCPDKNWAHGGPIIERERIYLMPWKPELAHIASWTAKTLDGRQGTGHTTLIAAMRAYVASKFGDTVPDEAG